MSTLPSIIGSGRMLDERRSILLDDEGLPGLVGIAGRRSTQSPTRSRLALLVRVKDEQTGEVVLAAIDTFRWEEN